MSKEVQKICTNLNLTIAADPGSPEPTYLHEGVFDIRDVRYFAFQGKITCAGNINGVVKAEGSLDKVNFNELSGMAPTDQSPFLIDGLNVNVPFVRFVWYDAASTEPLTMTSSVCLQKL